MLAKSLCKPQDVQRTKKRAEIELGLRLRLH